MQANIIHSHSNNIELVDDISDSSKLEIENIFSIDWFWWSKIPHGGIVPTFRGIYRSVWIGFK